MKSWLWTALVAWALSFGWNGSAAAQGCGPQNPNCVVQTRPAGDSSNAAASTAFVTSAIRQKLTANITIFVDGTNGNNNNNGLTSGTAWANFVPVYNYLCNVIDGQGFAVTISVANASSIVGPGGSGGAFNLSCDPIGVEFVILNLGGGILTPASGFDAIQISMSIVRNGAAGLQGYFFIENGTITCSGGGAGVHIISGSATIFSTGGTVSFGTCTGGTQIFMDGPSARLFLSGGYTLSGSAGFHWSSVAGGLIDFNTTNTITCTGTPAFTTFANAGGSGANPFWLGQIYAPTGVISFSGCGGVTGQRYSATLNSVINTGGGGANFLPGNAVGTTASGGQYN